MFLDVAVFVLLDVATFVLQVTRGGVRVADPVGAPGGVTVATRTGSRDGVPGGERAAATSHAVATSDMLQRALMLLVGVLWLFLDAHCFRCSSWCNMCSLFV
jgi:hypothetical protein